MPGSSKQAMAFLEPMKQASLGLSLSAKKKLRKREFLEQTQRVVPWAARVALTALVAPYYPEGRTGCPPFALETVLRVHFAPTMVRPVEPLLE